MTDEEKTSGEDKKAVGGEDKTPTLLKYADFNYGEFLKRRNVRFLVVILVVIGALLLGFWLRSIFVPLLAALMLAYILNPLVVWLQNKGLSRLKAVLAIFAGFFVLATGAVALTLPALVSNIGDIVSNYPTYLEKMETRAHEVVGWYNTQVPESAQIPEENVSNASSYVSEFVRTEFNTGGAGIQKIVKSDSAQAVAMSATDMAAHVFGTLLKWLLFATLVPLYTFYFMMGLDRIWGSTRDHLPGAHRDKFVSILTEIHVMVSAFFRGRLAICLIVAGLTTGVFLAFGVPFAVVLGLLGGFGVIIPFFSIIASLIPAVLLMLVGGEASTAAIVGVTVGFLVIQAIEQYWLTPKILGKAVELHPVTLLVGVFVMAELFGIFGALLAVPLTAIAKIVGRELILPYFKSLAAEKPAPVADAK